MIKVDGFPKRFFILFDKESNKYIDIQDSRSGETGFVLVDDLFDAYRFEYFALCAIDWRKAVKSFPKCVIRSMHVCMKEFASVPEEV